MADLTWAEAKLWTKSMALRPCPSGPDTVTGNRSSLSRQSKRAPIEASGPVTRFIGRLRRLASPSKVVMIG